MILIWTAMGYDEAVDVLQSWAGRRVIVIARGAEVDASSPYSMAEMRGRLGEAELGRSGIRTPRERSARFRLGPEHAGASPQDGFMLRAWDFVEATRTSTERLVVSLAAGFTIEVRLR